MQTETITCADCGQPFTIKFAVRPKFTSCPKCKKSNPLQHETQQRDTGHPEALHHASPRKPTEYDLRTKRRSRKLAFLFTGIGVYLLLWGVTWLTNSAILDEEARQLGGAYINTPAPFVAIAYRNTAIYEYGVLVKKSRQTEVIVWPVFWGGERALGRVRELGPLPHQR